MQSSPHTSPIGTAWIAETKAAIAKHETVLKRGLTVAEIIALEAGGNRSAEWARVRVRVDALGTAFDPRTVCRNVFVGNVDLGDPNASYAG